MENIPTYEEIKTHLADIQGFYSGLLAFGVIGKSHPLYIMLNEMAIKNKKMYERVSNENQK